MNEQTTYGIIGAGAIGQALGATLRRAGQDVVFWDRDTSKSSVKDLPDLAKAANVIILAIPSAGVRDVLGKLRASLSDSEHTVLTVAKGVDAGFVTMDAVLREELGNKNQIGVLCGPMLAGELIANEGGYGTLAMSAPQPDIVAHFRAGGLRLQSSAEIRAVAICSVLKNIYSLGLGVADALDVSMNTKAALTSRMLAEMQLVLAHLQLPTEVALQYCGLGDLLATGWGEASYNHRVGEEIGDDARTQPSGEGYNSLMEISSVLELSNFPIIGSLSHIILNKAPADELLDTLNR